jgi:hypothetical protein
MSTIAELEERVRMIEKRNQSVELDKAWEVSAVRRVLIAVLTYLVIAAYLSFRDVSDPWGDAVVPVVGFVLSTLVVGAAKSLWVRRKMASKN